MEKGRVQWHKDPLGRKVDLKMNSKCYKVRGTQENGTLNVVCFYVILPSFISDIFLSLYWMIFISIPLYSGLSHLIKSKQLNIHVPLSPHSLLWLCRLLFPHHHHISFAVHLGCLYCFIHFSLLNCDLASNTNYHTTEAAFQVYVAKSNSYHTWFTKQQ